MTDNLTEGGVGRPRTRWIHDEDERHFSQVDAQALLGRCIRTKVEFSGVPAGTAGTVTRTDKGSSPEGYTVAIQWNLPDRPRPLVDWFTRDEYQSFLEDL
ncbi:MAG: hypothetical protein LC647_10790 [Beggiatoa sp.]|nr:hypothetical protein [Beggiatoa sp.]